MPGSRALLLAACVAAAAAGVGCKGGGNGTPGNGGSGGGGTGGGGDSDGGLARSQLLAAFGTCAADRTIAFRDRAIALDEAAAALAADPAATPEGARTAFGEAMEVWQGIEMMQFGPTGSGATVVGGKSFRDNIYAWPAFGRCGIDEAIADESYTTSTFGTTFLVNRRGMAALEYLLFYDGADTECAAGSAGQVAWAALDVQQIRTRKRAYARVAAADVRTRAVALAEAWDPGAGNFVETMRSAGSGSAVYRTPQAAIESVGIALFYLDTMVKDDKLTMPLDTACASATCLESRYAGRSKANIRANLDALRRILEGCGADYAGLGFDDLLTSMNAGGAATALHDAAVAAQASLDAIEEADLAEALVNDRASVVALRDSIQTITTLLKTDFVTLLGFEPASIPTDND